ncbi:PGDYG domain-containing protein [Desertibacillus haloalkaliphilus]|uniref:PGDYG domain-containing protein n=1 Tax=Desertibacillus haloalkaliphilus TaxID=1328930 RepID=UPI001FE38148|nr:PGDYG domain-containing protein [Desertibacillus haloalkaliphilus]
MAKYRTKPVVIEAVKLTRSITIETGDGVIEGQPGDYLITDANGEQYPCKPDLFKKTYEPIKDSTHVKAFFKSTFSKLKRKSKQLFQSKNV